MAEAFVSHTTGAHNNTSRQQLVGHALQILPQMNGLTIHVYQHSTIAGSWKKGVAIKTFVRLINRRAHRKNRCVSHNYLPNK